MTDVRSKLSSQFIISEVIIFVIAFGLGALTTLFVSIPLIVIGLVLITIGTVFGGERKFLATCWDTDRTIAMPSTRLREMKLESDELREKHKAPAKFDLTLIGGLPFLIGLALFSF